MNLENSKDELLKNFEQRTREKEFFRAEYFKRKVMSDRRYHELNNAFASIMLEFQNATDYNVKQFYLANEADIIIIVQRYFCCKLLESNQLGHEDFNLTHLSLDAFLAQDHIHKILCFFYDISFEYCYFVNDLLDPTNMTTLMKKMDDELPPPPYYHMNKYAHKSLSKEVLSCFYFDHTVPNIIEFETLNQTSKFNEILDSVLQESKLNPSVDSSQFWDQYPPQTGGVKVGTITRFADFVITGCTLAKDFDIAEVTDEISDHIAWVLFEQKRKHNIKMTDKEIQFCSKVYDKTAKGKYGSNYRESRLAGLWIWDKLQHNDAENVTEAIKMLTDSKLLKYSISSEERTIRRMYKLAMKCIDEGEVFAMNEK